MARKVELLVVGIVGLVLGGGLFGLGLRRGMHETRHPPAARKITANGVNRPRRAHRLFNRTEPPMFFNRTQHLLKVRERLKTRDDLSDKQREKMELQVIMNKRRGRRVRRDDAYSNKLRGALAQK